MNTSKTRFILDLQKTQSQIALPVTRGDTAREWYITLSDGTVPYIITDGALAKIEIKRPTGTHMEAFCPIENNMTLKYDFAQNENTAAVSGIHECAIVLFDEEGDIVGTPRFTMIVSDRVIESDDIQLSDEDQLLIGSMLAAEISRQAAEAERCSSEAERIAAEAQRKENEQIRQSAEAERTASETARKTGFEALKKEAETAAATLVSPTVEVQAVDGGQKITLTDKNGKKSFWLTNGKDGYTPQKGVDYYTEHDKSEISEYVTSELAKRGQLVPEYANDVSECTDTSKMYVLPDGFIYAYMLTEKEVEGGQQRYTNKLPAATDTDGTTIYGADYNGDGVNDGYLKFTRLSGSGGSTATANTEQMCASGFISAKAGDTIRIKGTYPVSAIQSYVISYDSSKTKISNRSFSQDTPGAAGTPDWDTPTGMNWSPIGTWYTLEDGNCVVIELTSENFGTDIAFIRFSGHMTDDTIVTVNEEIAEGGGTTVVKEYGWASTGHAFVPADYEDRIINLENNIKILATGNGTISLYTNVLKKAIDIDGSVYNGVGYKSGSRINSSDAYVEAANRCHTGYISATPSDTIRIKNMYNPTDGHPNGYIHFYDSDFARIGYAYEEIALKFVNGELKFKINEISLGYGNLANMAYFRISTGTIDDTSIITINEEIIEIENNENAGNDTNADVPMTEEERVALIKNWDSPIYDANIPVFELSAEKAAMTSAPCTPDDIYAKYDALMAKHPHYITKTDLGLCSDGVNHVFRYDFKESDSRHTSGYGWSETKAKAIIVSGIHYEWAGIYGLYYALEEIAENPELRNLRRNTHLIVVPCMNPYATIASNYTSNANPNSIGVLNKNGVQIHRNFEVGFIYPGESGYVEYGERNHGGTTPLSEAETQYVDNIMKENTDAAFFLTCHNFADTSFNFIWPSVATKYMCNMGYRLIDKMSNAWNDKYEFAGLEDYRTDDIPSWDNRLGFAHISSSPGTETRQATKYGIQGANVEINAKFWVHGTKENPEPAMSSFTMSRGAEVYINFLLTAFGCYDPKDKEQYFRK